MITAYLQGGLGNQMFQIAAAEALAYKNNEVARFNFNECHTPLQGIPSSKYKDTFFKNFIHDSTKFELTHTEVEIGHKYKPILYEKNSGLILVGFFQSEKYFKEYPEVVDKFYFEDSIKLKVDSWLKNIPHVKIGIHVRRGDYLNNPSIHPSCPIKYYTWVLNSYFGQGDYSFIFVSDDIAWVKDTFKGDKKDDLYYSEFTDELEDLYLLSRCNHNIIANSTFSWWGAYLNKNPKKLVIAPKVWFGPDGPQDYQDIVPESWYKV